MLMYGRLQNNVLRARLRIDLLHALHEAQLNPFNLRAVVVGYPVITAALDKALVDLADVSEAWRSCRCEAPEKVAQCSDGLVVALAKLLQQVDPGWLHRRRRDSYRRDQREAKDFFEAAFRAFDLLARADAAPRRSDRKAARQTIEAHIDLS